MSTPTSERIVEEAMRLFSVKGYKGASIAQIEKAAGLSPGAGGLYRHFESKEAVLAAGISRHLDRLDALRDVRQAMGTLVELDAQLEATARYFLDELDSQTELLQILASEIRQSPALLGAAVNQLIESTYASFAEWLQDAAGPGLDAERARTISTIALGSLLSTRLLRNVLGVTSASVEDDEIISSWVEVVRFLLDR
jgi:AcrR family transcriptional regulator